MFWKLFRLQALLDTLFDDGWLCLALDGRRADDDEAAAPLQQA